MSRPLPDGPKHRRQKNRVDVVTIAKTPLERCARRSQNLFAFGILGKADVTEHALENCADLSGVVIRAHTGATEKRAGKAVDDGILFALLDEFADPCNGLRGSFVPLE